MNNEEQGKKMGQIIARCWSDEAFKQRLLADPVATLQAEGVVVPAGLSVKVFENTDQVFNLVIPAKPKDLSDSDLDRVAGGTLSRVQCAPAACGLLSNCMCFSGA